MGPHIIERQMKNKFQIQGTIVLTVLGLALGVICSALMLFWISIH
ncbi:hypothetical protein [Solitalea longa]|nr:hypothetical protein [Solitalea longa]